MENDYTFRSRFFALDDKSLFLLRRNFPHKTLKTSEVRSVRICKGTDNKRPMLSSVIGVVLLIAAFYNVFVMISEVDPGYFETGISHRAGHFLRGFVRIVFMFGFLAALGGLLLYRSLPIHSILEFSMLDGSVERVSIEDEDKPDRKESLLRALANAIGKEKISG